MAKMPIWDHAVPILPENLSSDDLLHDEGFDDDFDADEDYEDTSPNTSQDSSTVLTMYFKGPNIPWLPNAVGTKAHQTWRFKYEELIQKVIPADLERCGSVFKYDDEAYCCDLVKGHTSAHGTFSTVNGLGSWGTYASGKPMFKLTWATREQDGYRGQKVYTQSTNDDMCGATIKHLVTDNDPSSDLGIFRCTRPSHGPSQAHKSAFLPGVGEMVFKDPTATTFAWTLDVENIINGNKGSNAGYSAPTFDELSDNDLLFLNGSTLTKQQQKEINFGLVYGTSPHKLTNQYMKNPIQANSISYAKVDNVQASNFFSGDMTSTPKNCPSVYHGMACSREPNHSGGHQSEHFNARWKYEGQKAATFVGTRKKTLEDAHHILDTELDLPVPYRVTLQKLLSYLEN